MDSLKTVAAKVKHSPQIIRKTFANPQKSYNKVTEGEKVKGKHQEDWLHAEDSLKEGIHFYVKMLGSCPVTRAQGSGCTDEAVQTIITNTKKAKNNPGGGSLQKVLVTVSTRKLLIQDMVTKEKVMDIPIYRISYCVADPYYTKVFAFISREQGRRELNCYAFLCSKDSMAQAMALTIADAFKIAFECHARGKAANNEASSAVEKAGNKGNSQQPVSVANNGSGDIYATPVKVKQPPADPPSIQVTDDYASAAAAVQDSGRKLEALDLAVDDDDFDAEFTKLAESRSNPNLFETPVRRRDFMDDVNYLMATEATAKQMMMSKSSEDLSFI
ncbi:low density lipoprotein receptor adapter protein 1-like [Montipora foliosa]|uniref:low density lipoprotein receptor adapter protein 1-like n=1 Tax=Montipora foliosa TaxID=591990 RepID=UPI0035F1F599